MLSRLHPLVKDQVRNLGKMNKRKVQTLYGVKVNQTYLYMFIYIYIYIYIYINVNIYIHVCIYTNTYINCILITTLFGHIKRYQTYEQSVEKTSVQTNFKLITARNTHLNTVSVEGLARIVVE